MPEPDGVVLASIRMILDRRTDERVPVELGSNLYDDLELDSLELAELSAVLEDELGRDPYTDGILPQTVGDIVGFYSESF